MIKSEVQAHGRINSISEISKSVLVLLSLGAALIGGIAGFFTFVISYERERSAWDQIKAAHDVQTNVLGQYTYSHADLTDSDIAEIRARLNLPDFGDFALIADIQTEQQIVAKLLDLGFIKSGETVKIKDAIDSSIALTRWNTKIIEALQDNRQDLPGSWARTWTFEKVN